MSIEGSNITIDLTRHGLVQLPVRSGPRAKSWAKKIGKTVGRREQHGAHRSHQIEELQESAPHLVLKRLG